MSDPSVFSALADPTRRSVYERLSAKGPASASHIATELPISRQAIAKHLTLLQEAGLVDRTTEGREVLYSARLEPLNDVEGWIRDVGAAWDARFEQLGERFREDTGG